MGKSRQLECITDVLNASAKEIPEVDQIFELDEIEMITKLNQIQSSLSQFNVINIAKSISGKILINRR